MSLSGMIGATLEGDEAGVGDHSFSLQRKRSNFHNFKIISLVAIYGLNFQSRELNICSRYTKRYDGKLPPSNTDRIGDI